MSSPDPGTSTPPKANPDGLALRSPPRPVMRLNRRSLVIAATGLALIVAISTMWALQPHHATHGAGGSTELYNVDRVAKADNLDRLPADYSKLPPRPAPPGEPAPTVPELGPPLPGELGGPLLRASGNAPPSADHPMGGGGRTDALDIARAPVFFRTSSSERSEATPGSTPPVGSGTPNGLANALNALSGAPPAAPNDATALQNRQDQKEAFLANGGDTATRNPGSVQPPGSPNTVMAGTVIPAALVTGINSDLPGQVIATVTQPIYDTATGRILLIPQGSRLIGRYDSQVSFGQRRVLLVWLRIILPDTSSITLDKLPGIDPAGYAGLEDGVDWHWSRVLAGAALATLLGVSPSSRIRGVERD